MVRRFGRFNPSRSRSPHPRGDGPPDSRRLRDLSEFSPPAWGWSGANSHERRAGVVLPTRVGMVLIDSLPSPLPPRSPHPRGDGPATSWRLAGWRRFSPPAWGWSGVGEGQVAAGRVLPTRVGMVRTVRPDSYDPNRSPHPRGDGPSPRSPAPDLLKFSPPAWGWSGPGKLKRAYTGHAVRERERQRHEQVPPHHDARREPVLPAHQAVGCADAPRLSQSFDQLVVVSV